MTRSDPDCFMRPRKPFHQNAQGNTPISDAQQRDKEQISWTGHLDYENLDGYEALFELGVVKVGCMAQARRKFVEIHTANKNTLAAAAPKLIGQAQPGRTRYA